MTTSGTPSSDHERRLDEAIESYLKMKAEGQTPERDQWLAMNPDLAVDLAEFLDDVSYLKDALCNDVDQTQDGQSVPFKELLLQPGRSIAGGFHETRSLLETLSLESLTGSDAVSPLTIPGYEFIRELGRGGMGVVYEARQVRLNRTVALKMILGGKPGQSELVRFHAEAEAIARVQHPHIVQIYEVGNQGNTPFLALEFCDQGTLKQQLQDAPLKPEEAAHVVEQLARGIQAAHERNLIHRDLKPQNILRTVQVDGQGNARSVYKITDFGLAKKLDETGQTAAGDILGTPSYMAPEQALGNMQMIGTACDVYALGATLYECLTGRPPFRGATALDTIYQVIHNDPAPPGALQPNLPRDIETICLKCLEKDIRRRYGSAADLAADLSRFQRHEPIRARTTSFWERIGKWTTRHPDWAALGIVATIAVAALAGLLVAQVYRSQLANSNLQLQVSLAEVDGARRSEADQKVQLEAALGRVEQVRYFNLISLAAQAIERKEYGRAEELLVRCPSPLRNWEWHFLSGMAFVSHEVNMVPGKVTCSAVSHGAEHWAMGTLDGQVHLKLGRITAFQKTLTDSSVPVAALAFSQNLEQLAVVRGSLVQIIQLPRPTFGQTLDPQTTFPVRQYLTAGGPITAVAFAANDRQIATATSEAIQIWDLTSGTELRRIEDESPLQNVTFRADGESMAWTNGEKVRYMTRNASTPTTIATVSNGVAQLAWRSDKKWLYVVSVGDPWYVQAWDVDARTEAGRFVRLSSSELICSPDGQWLATPRLRAIELTAWPAPHQRLSLLGHQGRVAGALFRPDGKLLLSWAIVPDSNESEVISWNMQSLPQPILLGKLPEPTCVTFLLNGQRIAAGNAQGQIRMWDVSGRLLSTIQAHTGKVTQLALSSDGIALASTGTEGTTRLRLAGTGEEIASLPQLASKLIFPRNELLLTVLGWPTVTLDLKGQRHSGPLPEQMESFAADLSCNRFVVSDPEWGLGIWATELGQEIRLTKQRDCRCACFRPDGHQVAWVDDSGLLHVATLNGTSLKKLPLDQTGPVHQLAYNSTGERLATVSDEGAIQIWATDSGEAVVTIPLDSPARAIAFSPNDDLTVACADGRLVLWRLSNHSRRIWSEP